MVSCTAEFSAPGGDVRKSEVRQSDVRQSEDSQTF